APGKCCAENSLNRKFRVYAAGIDGEAGALGWKSAFRFTEAEFVPDEVHQVGRIFTIMNREGSIEADLIGVLAQDPRANSMEGSCPGQRVGNDAGVIAHDLAGDPFDPAGHLGRGP